MRLAGLERAERQRLIVPIAVVVCYSATVTLTNSELLLRFYPVLMNVMMGLMFAVSLYHGPPVLERMARLRKHPMHPASMLYLRRLTAVWVGYFVVSASIATWTAVAASLKVWTLYNGFISYVFMGLLLVLELPVRSWYKKRHPEPDANASTPAT